jgi:hypothetical protein
MNGTNANPIDLRKLIPTEEKLSERLIWVEFQSLRFQIRFVSKITLSALAESCTLVGYDKTNKTHGRKLNPEKFVQEMCATIVKNWDNVTLRTLSGVIVLDGEFTEAQLDEPIPFSNEQLVAVVTAAHELDTFLQECATEAALFKSESARGLEKNSQTSQSTT